MKKVLAIAPYPFLPYFSGGQKYIAQFLEHLGRQATLGVVGTNGNDWSLSRFYTPYPLLKRSFSRYYDSGLAKKISDLVVANGYQTIVWEHPYYAWLARRVKERTGTKMVLHTHNIEHLRFRSLGRWWWPILKRYEKRAFQEADHIFFISPEDRQWAIDNWQVEAGKCTDLPFGVEPKHYPSDRQESRNFISRKYGINNDEKIILFNGLLNYKPNLDALRVILDELNPLLLKDHTLRYKIIICGKGLPSGFNELKEHKANNIVYAGFVEDIIPYFKSADMFLNPVQSGGGIKTKMVEAIAYGATVIATNSGAAGIREDICGQKLVKVSDNDWPAFVTAIKENLYASHATPPEYYNYYQWDNVIRNALAFF